MSSTLAHHVQHCHLTLSRALVYTLPHVTPISSSSFITVLQPVVFGRPLWSSQIPSQGHFGCYWASLGHDQPIKACGS